MANPVRSICATALAKRLITELLRFRRIVRHRAKFQLQVSARSGANSASATCWRAASSSPEIGFALIDAASGAHRWAERYDRELEDVFAVQDEVTWAIVSTLAAHVTQAERERTRTKPPATWQAYDYYLKAGETFGCSERLAARRIFTEVRRLLEQSLAIDPGFARAYGRLAITYLATWHHPLDGDFLNPDTVERAYQLTRKAVQLDPTSPQAHADMGDMLTWKGDHDASIVAFDKAIALNPNFSDGRFALTFSCLRDSLSAQFASQKLTRVSIRFIRLR